MGPPFFISNFTFPLDLQPTCIVSQQSHCMFYGMALSLQCILSFAQSCFFFFTKADWHCYKLKWKQALFRNIHGDPPEININHDDFLKLFPGAVAMQTGRWGEI